MIAANQLKNGVVININNSPHIVQSITKQTPSARGGSTLYKIRAKNLLKSGKSDITCKGDDNFSQPDFHTKQVQYLYDDGSACIFMDLESYEQLEISKDIIKDELPYLLENMEGIGALILDDCLVGIKLPASVQLRLVECDPSIKGASATARTKPAITETGLTVQVPEYLSVDEIIKIDTTTGKYLSRA